MPEIGTSPSSVELRTTSAPYPYGLLRAPFDDSIDEEFFFPSDQHVRAMEFMGQLLWTRSRLGVVTASHGC